MDNQKINFKHVYMCINAMRHVTIRPDRKAEGAVRAAVMALRSVEIETAFMEDLPNEPLMISRQTLRELQAALARFEVDDTEPAT